LSIIIQAIDGLYQVIWWLVIARCVVSWLPINPHNSVVRFIYEVTEPLLSPFRKLLPSGLLGLDFSPILLLVVLGLARRILITLLLGI